MPSPSLPLATSSLGLVFAHLAGSVYLMASVYESRFASRLEYWRSESCVQPPPGPSYPAEEFSGPRPALVRIVRQHECFDPDQAPSFDDFLSQVPTPRRGGLTAYVPAVLISFWYASSMLDDVAPTDDVAHTLPSLNGFYCYEPRSVCAVYITPDISGHLQLDEFLFDGAKHYIAPSADLAAQKVYATARSLGTSPKDAEDNVKEIWSKRQ